SNRQGGEVTVGDVLDALNGCHADTIDASLAFIGVSRMRPSSERLVPPDDPSLRYTWAHLAVELIDGSYSAPLRSEVDEAVVFGRSGTWSHHPGETCVKVGSNNFVRCARFSATVGQVLKLVNGRVGVDDARTHWGLSLVFGSVPVGAPSWEDLVLET